MLTDFVSNDLSGKTNRQDIASLNCHKITFLSIVSQEKSSVVLEGYSKLKPKVKDNEHFQEG